MKGDRKMRHEPSSGTDDDSLNYSVTWRSTDGSGTEHEEVFESRDQGWDFYQQKQKSIDATDVSWDHIPA